MGEAQKVRKRGAVRNFLRDADAQQSLDQGNPDLAGRDHNIHTQTMMADPSGGVGGWSNVV